MRIILRILGFLKPYKKLTLAAYAALLGSTLLSLALPRLLGESIDKVLAQGQLRPVVLFGVVIIVIALTRGVFSFGENFLREALAQRVAYRIRNAIYDHLQRLSFAYHDKQQTGQLMSRTTVDVENIRMFVAFAMIRSTYLIILVGAIAGLLITINWGLALITLGFVPFVIVRGTFIARKLRGIWMIVQQRTGELGVILQESLTGIRVVKAFARQDYEDRKFSDKAGQLTNENLQTVRVQASNTPLMTFIFAGLMALVLWYGGREIIRGALTPGEMAQFLLYMAMLQAPVRMSGFMLNMFSRVISSGQRVFEILDAQSPVQEKPGAIEMQDVRGRLSFESVGFKYEGASPVLHDLSFRAEPGQMIALLGATGSGKSTVVHLIPRFYDVSEGRILLDTTDIRDASLESLRQQVGIVQQDVFLFSATMRDNIAYGAVDASDERVEWASRVARIHDFIVGLPDGYETWVGERGITLSGGQKQRVAIARTLLIDPAVLILDDSTSSVDTATEHLIQQALAELVKGRTTVVIAQRLSTVKRADLILVLKEGRVIQRGTHAELVQQENGLYREIYEMQLRPQEEAQIDTLEEARS